MNGENTALRNKPDTEGTRLYEMFRTGKTIGIGSKLLVARGWNEGKLKVTANRYWDFFLELWKCPGIRTGTY